MALVDVKDLLEAGVHYGHRASRWNPKMRPYIYGKRNLIHIIDLRETVRGLLRSYRYLSQVVGKGQLVLFVGTKRQGKEILAAEATRCGMPYVNERWLGGTLTNFKTIRNRLNRLKELESMWLAEGDRHDRQDMNKYIATMMTEAGKLDQNKAPETAAIHRYSKKMVSNLNRELLKIRRNLSGIREMNRLPDALVIVDPKREHIGIKEAQRMGITTIALIDTDSDPDPVDLPIPGNDDSIRAIEVIVSKLADAVLEGRAALPPEQQTQMRGAASAGGGGGRQDRGPGPAPAPRGPIAAPTVNQPAPATVG